MFLNFLFTFHKNLGLHLQYEVTMQLHVGNHSDKLYLN
jgi:hypothetical protein